MKKGIYLALAFLLSCNSKVWQGRSDSDKWLRAYPDLEKATSFSSINKQLRVFDFQKNETVANIGSYDGTYEALYALQKDSIRFYVQDIDSSGFKNLPKIIRHFENIKGKPLSCTFNFVLGSEKNTNLPVGEFDKIIIIEAFHHFTYPNEILQNIKACLKPGGKLFIDEPLAKKTKLKGAEPRYSKNDFLTLLEKNGFRLVSETPNNGRFIIFSFETK